MASGSAKNNRRRAVLHERQGCRCHYCPDPIGILKDGIGNPVLDHYIPRSVGGTRLVLACASCDKIKGMIPGPEFECMIQQHIVWAGRSFKDRTVLAAACKARNIELQQNHPARAVGMVKTQERTAQRAIALQITVTEYARPLDRGDEARERHIAEWAASHPSVGDKYYQAWTGKSPA